MKWFFKIWPVPLRLLLPRILKRGHKHRKSSVGPTVGCWPALQLGSAVPAPPRRPCCCPFSSAVRTQACPAAPDTPPPPPVLQARGHFLSCLSHMPESASGRRKYCARARNTLQGAQHPRSCPPSPWASALLGEATRQAGFLAAKACAARAGRGATISKRDILPQVSPGCFGGCLCQPGSVPSCGHRCGGVR